VQRSVELQRSQTSSACGTQTWWAADASVDADGRLAIWHNGPAPYAPSPAPTAK
jgi:hypothetical protein